ncbi:MAG: hypothetical protein AAF219_08840, partial [Myxococcota bacterium]
TSCLSTVGWSRAACSTVSSSLKGRIRVPTTVVASDDPFLPRDFLSQALVHAVAGAQGVHVANAGHYVHLEAPEAVRVHYNQWLSTLP